MDEAEATENRLRDWHRESFGWKDDQISSSMNFFQLDSYEDYDGTEDVSIGSGEGEDVVTVDGVMLVGNNARSNEDAPTVTSTPLSTSVTMAADVVIREKLVVLLLRKCLSSPTMVQLLEQLLECQISARGDVPSGTATGTTNTFTIGDVQNSIKYQTNEQGKLQGWIERIIDAQSVLDHDRQRPTSRPLLAKKKSSGGTDENLATTLMVQELRRIDDDALQKRAANTSNRMGGANTNENMMESFVSREVPMWETNGSGDWFMMQKT